MRQKFPASVKRDALKRGGGLCEGEGKLYGLAEGIRCNRDLAYGVHFDHVNPDGNGGKPTLENCAAVCPECNMHKAWKSDTPRIAKMKRQRDRNAGIKTRKGRPMPGTRASGIRKHMNGDVSTW
jgi:5-methylcytosine-specific restriction protein A